MRRVKLAIVGGGPAGYAAAHRLAQLGQEVVLVEKAALGGVCLNQGCIPTKALYVATDLLAQAESARKMGVELKPSLDLARLRNWTQEVIHILRQGIEKLLASVEVLFGEARLVRKGQLLVRLADREEVLEAKTIVLATGSAPIELPGLPFDGERIWSSQDAVQLPRVPEHLVVVGGGVIGLELATIYRRLGSQVTVVEMMGELLPGVGISRRSQAVLAGALRDQGITLLLRTTAHGLTRHGLIVRTQEGELELPCEAVLVAAGRRPKSDDLGLETVGIQPVQGYIPTDDNFRAGEGIYAIGDLRGGPLLAHKALHEGLSLADRLGNRTQTATQNRSNVIPQAIFTQPELGIVGLSPDVAKEQGLRVGWFPVRALGRALAEGNGHFQIVADEDGRIKGAEIIGPHATELIAEAALAIQAGLNLEEFAATIHAHPTFSEGIWEAALSALGRPLHGGH